MTCGLRNTAPNGSHTAAVALMAIAGTGSGMAQDAVTGSALPESETGSPGYYIHFSAACELTFKKSCLPRERKLSFVKNGKVFRSIM